VRGEDADVLLRTGPRSSVFRFLFPCRHHACRSGGSTAAWRPCVRLSRRWVGFDSGQLKQQLVVKSQASAACTGSNASKCLF
jgi:hypothetical protein